MKQIPGLDMKAAERWRPRFLSTLARTGNVVRSAQRAKIKPHTAYKHRRNDAEFAKEWEAALDEAIDRLEGHAFERAREYSDTLTIFLLKAHRPEKYGETLKHQISGVGGAPIQITSPVERDARLAELIAGALGSDHDTDA